MNLLNELRDHGYILKYEPLKIACAVFEDNSGSLHMANLHKYRPQAKHLNVIL